MINLKSYKLQVQPLKLLTFNRENFISHLERNKPTGY